MKAKNIYLYIFLLFIGSFCLESVHGQVPVQDQTVDPRVRFPSDETGKEDEKSSSALNRDTVYAKVKEAYLWKITPRTGERLAAIRDSSRLNFHRRTLSEEKSLLVNYLGNIGTPTIAAIYFDRPDKSRFSFEDNYSYWRKGPKDQLFLNTKIPYSHILYQSGGGARSKEERLMGELSSNFGKKLNIGMNVDYLYDRGYYKNLSNKQIDYDLNASYIGDKYKMHFFFGHNKFDNLENGGLSDTRYITHPDDEGLNQTLSGSLDYPVRIEDEMWNRTRGTHLFLSNRYDIGDNMEQVMGTDSIMRWRKKQNYIAPASVILTTHYQDQRRRIKSNSTTMDTAYQYYHVINGVKNDLDAPHYITPIDDYMSYWSLKNTLALSLNEGFRPWMKFGLSAFVEYDWRKYAIPDFYKTEFADGTMITEQKGFTEKEEEKALFVGGELTSSKQEILQYKARFEKDLLNADMKLEGEVRTNFELINRSFSITANAKWETRTTSFFEKNFSSKYWSWNNSFNSVKVMRIGGELESKSTNTKLSFDFENIQNPIYYGDLGLIAQASGGVRILSARLDQNMSFGIFHWDNSLVYQYTKDDDIIPLPKLSLLTNVYMKTQIAKVLSLQMGVDASIHTKYYMPGYEPLTMQFYNQREEKIGEFPVVNIYANFHIKHARFFVMLYNAANGMGNGQSFSAYKYPINPRILKFGLSWYFNN